MYLAIEGVIGVGKTSLARLLHPMFHAALLLEAFEENPFLSDFYADRRRYAFQTQIFFLLSRYHQQRDHVPQALDQGSLVADYTFQKDALFARLNLEGDELETYFKLHAALAERLHPPDLTVYLRVRTATALQRIALRDRSYERDMDPQYIGRLNEAYEDYFTGPADGSTLVIDTDELDYVHRPADLDDVASRIRNALGIRPYQPSLPFAPGKMT
ncbi:MAG TPA: deoxynucleoside kinase [Anaerolineales bacterium]|nr:deoxynucleoside kinase [Anaerolineales bacterium]